MSRKIYSCNNCGECCGPVQINILEYTAIELFLQKHPEIAEFAKSKDFSLHCVFRDEEKKRCLIYDVRPVICKLYTCQSEAWEKDIPEPNYLINMFGIHFINECFGNPKYREKFLQEYNRHLPEIMELVRKKI